VIDNISAYRFSFLFTRSFSARARLCRPVPAWRRDDMAGSHNNLLHRTLNAIFRSELALFDAALDKDVVALLERSRTSLQRLIDRHKMKGCASWYASATCRRCP
jgi:hypothetical protein